MFRKIKYRLLRWLMKDVFKRLGEVSDNILRIERLIDFELSGMAIKAYDLWPRKRHATNEE